MPPEDNAFDGLARYYDTIMEFVNYDRWQGVCEGLETLLPPHPVHVDFACGTGVLVEKMRRRGFRTVGFDLSRGMAALGRNRRNGLPLCCADMRAVPFGPTTDFVTCLFDSLNFLLDEASVRAAVAEMARVLKPGGLLLFDVVTETMILEHFVGPEWEENNGKFRLRWKTEYDRREQVAYTRLRVNTGQAYEFRERVYPNSVIDAAIADAGLHLLGQYDAERWRAVTPKTARIDYLAVKPPADAAAIRYPEVEADIRRRIAALPDAGD
ncbi:MAG: methyltransferase domain-containing protein [Candidatus Hydrogenedens sp.]|nr:methyltransferase domain-containing protein [Candidatus Hydrogenedens sp.]